MPDSHWGTTPRQSIASACERRGRAYVLSGCVDLVVGRDADPDLVLALGGPGAAHVLSDATGTNDYWLRVWGTRGLLWAWDDSATDVLVGALGDEAWRVRELAAKVAAKHGVGKAVGALATLRDDPVARVRTAAARALVRLTAEGA